MGIRDFFSWPGRDHLGELQRRQDEAEVNMAMVKQGWTIFPPDATSEQIGTSIDSYITTGEAQWYPPGYAEEPVISEGKLSVSLEPVEDDRPWWKFW